MFFISDVPPMTTEQVAQYEYFQTTEENLFVTEQETEAQALVFLKQANLFKFLHETQGDIRPAAESLAVANYIAYLEYMEKAGK